MNKNMIHVITLPALLASGVSLHVLSYAMEEPPEILASSPVPVTSTIVTDKEEVKNDDVNKDTPKNEPSENEPVNDKKTVKVTETKETKTEEVTKPEEDNKPVRQERVVSVKTETVSETSTQNVPALLTFLPSKTERDIIREAKLIGGRMDPFLSIKPPSVPEVPVLPQMDNIASMPVIPDNNNFNFDKPKNTQTKPSNKAPTPPKVLVPAFDDNNSKPVTPDNPDDPTITWDTVSLDAGVELTGIITGFKPLALITVDGESKVVAVGEFVRKDKKIKLVSINFESQEITVADNRNKSARIEIKE